MLVDEHRTVRRIARHAARLVWVRRQPDIFAGSRAWTRGHAGISASLAYGEERHFRPVAAHLLGRCGDVGYPVFPVAARIGAVALRPLRKVADPSPGRRR